MSSRVGSMSVAAMRTVSKRASKAKQERQGRTRRSTSSSTPLLRRDGSVERPGGSGRDVRSGYNCGFMQLLADYFPLLLFFVAFKWQGIYVATAVAIVASIAQIAWLYWKRGKVAIVNWLSLAIIAVFGGATLILQDDVFIRWKPTVLYGL